MSKYQELIQNPIAVEVENAREVIFTIVSCMCDNKNSIGFKKDKDGDFKIFGYGYSLSNYQMKCHISDLLWAADDQNWEKVVSLINTGTSQVSFIKSRG